MAQAIRNDIRPLIENKGKFLLVRSSSGHRHALKEVMQDPMVVAQLADAKVMMVELGTVRVSGETLQFVNKKEAGHAVCFYGYDKPRRFERS